MYTIYVNTSDVLKYNNLQRPTNKNKNLLPPNMRLKCSTQVKYS